MGRNRVKKNSCGRDIKDETMVDRAYLEEASKQHHKVCTNMES